MKDFLYNLILLGSIQGIIVCTLLHFSRRSGLPERLLAAIIGLITLPGIHLYFHYAGWFDINAVTLFIHDLLPLVVIMPLGPLIYFYIRSLAEPGFTIGKKERLHFIPVIIDLLPKLAALVFYAGKAVGWSPITRDRLAEMVDSYSQYADIPRWLSMTVYVVLSVQWLRNYCKKQEQNVSAGTLVRWMQLFLYSMMIFQLLWLAYLIPYIIPGSSGWLLNTVDWFPVYIPMSILIYWLGIKGWLVSNSRIEPKKPVPLPASEAEQAFLLLKHAMEVDRLYLDPELNLEKLSGHTGLNQKYISAVLNQYRETGFNYFINSYRVEAFKQRLAIHGSDQFTIAGLAMECGFNSPATFQRTFKQHTGVSPSAFRKTLTLG